MQINLQTQFTDGSTKSITAIAPDLVAFEREFDLSIARLEANVKLTHLFYLAWHAEKRTKATALDFDAWLETVEGISDTDVKK
jgi:hypothetical protein